MSKTLYRTYRPKDFADVLGQDHIVHTLQNAITSNRVSHAYIFTGPRGTGKTTIARLFATAINTTKRKDFIPVDVPIAKRLHNGTSLDVIEIDAASSTSVEGIRALKETIGTTPSEARYKVYIIDEVHMLSTSAFNALLKTLEEPPAHAIFILATTEIHKVPDTIISRCQRFDFGRFTVADIVKKLRMIAHAEKVKISDEALEMVAITANGGMRDAESLLAQVFALEDRNVTAQEVATILGTTTSQDVLTLLKALTTHHIHDAITQINMVQKNGYNLETFTRSLIEKIRALLFLTLQKDMPEKELHQLIALPKSDIALLTDIAHTCTPQTIIHMIEECTTALQKIKSTTIPQLPLEIAAVNICMYGDTISHQSPTKAPNMPITSPENRAKNASHTTDHVAQVIQNEIKTDARSDMSSKNHAHWHACIAEIDTMHRPIAQILRQCTLHTITDDMITIATGHTFYQERLTQNKHRQIIETALCAYFKKPMRITVLVDKESDRTSSDVLAYAKQLMGGAMTS